MSAAAKEKLLESLAAFPAEDLAFALEAARASQEAHAGRMYMLHHLLEQRVVCSGVSAAGLAECEIEAPVNRLSLNLLGMAHGGILAMLCDNAMAVACAAQAGNLGVTLSLTVNYHRPARDGMLRARGAVVHAGRRVNAARGEILDEGGRLIASASGTFYHREAPERGGRRESG